MEQLAPLPVFTSANKNEIIINKELLDKRQFNCAEAVVLSMVKVYLTDTAARYDSIKLGNFDMSTDEQADRAANLMNSVKNRDGVTLVRFNVVEFHENYCAFLGIATVRRYIRAFELMGYLSAHSVSGDNFKWYEA